MTTKKRVANIADLSKVQKFYITHHASRDVKQLALDVGCSQTLVKAFLAFLDKRAKKKEAAAITAAEREAEAAANAPPPTGVTTVKPPVAGDFFARNKKRGVTIMTPEAAQLGDNHKQQMSPRLAKNVYKIRPE